MSNTATYNNNYYTVTKEDTVTTITIIHDNITSIRICNSTEGLTNTRIFKNAELSEIDTPTTINLLPTDTSQYQLNKKYSGTSIVDANGRYLSPVIPVDINSCPYLNISGLKNGISGAKPYLYKVAFYIGNTLTLVEYWSNWGDDNTTAKTINLLDKGDYGQFNGIQLEIAISGSAITTNDIITDGSIIATLSATPTVIEE